MARLKAQYVNEIAPALNKKFGYKSVMKIPKLDKVIINVAAGEAKENVKVIDAIVAALGQITGQKAVVCKAKKSVANFKLRQGMQMCIRDSFHTLDVALINQDLADCLLQVGSRNVHGRVFGSAGAVSYTHLDVYKRQRPWCAAAAERKRSPGFHGGRGDAGGRHTDWA